MTQQLPIVGVLYGGEMGAAIGALLRGRGYRVIGTLEGRSERTARRCREAGIQIVPSLSELAATAQVVISLVSPEAAESVAEEYCRFAFAAPAAAVFVEANSIGPELADSLARRVRATGIAVVDGSINGLACNLASSATLYLSGDRAVDVQRLFDGAMRVRVLGATAGQASAMKMLLGGLTKGVCALYVELALTARQQGLLEELNLAMGRSYGGIKELVDRMLPTYPQHADRRVQEMRQAAGMVQSVGLEPCVLAGVERLHEEIARAVVEERGADRPSIEALIQRFAEEGVLKSLERTFETAAD
jgi:3-hydroxyisobutyrate dehydrogenase-like beta-hydroxyacid dehydrogenase